VAQHERCYERHQQVLELDHFLNVLQKKPGAMAGSTALDSVAHRALASQLRHFWRESANGRPSDWHAGDDRSPVVEPTYGCPRASGVEEALLMGTSSLSAIRYLLNVDCKPTATDLPSVELASCTAMTDRNPAWMLTNNCDRTGPRLHRQSQVTDCRLASSDEVVL